MNSLNTVTTVENELTQKQIVENTDTKLDKTMVEKMLQPHGILIIL